MTSKHNTLLLTGLKQSLVLLLFSLAGSYASAEQLIINYDDNGTITERCQFTLDGTAPVVIDSATGDITAQVTDPDACGSTTPVPPTVTVTPATATINLGSSQTISWTSTGATSCVKAGSWSGTASPNGNETVTPPSTGTFTYTITCTNNDGSASDSSVVTVTDPNVPAFCSTIPTFGLTEQHNPETYQDATGHPWPGIVSDSDFWSINSFQYSALSFVADSSTGTLLFEAGRPAEGPAAGYTIKISQCPGDFTRDISDPDVAYCQKSGAVAGISWSPTTQAGKCTLTPGVTYYLNVVHGNVENNSTFTNNCSSTFCSVAMQRTN